MSKRLTAPKKWVFWVSLIVVVLSTIAHYFVPAIPQMLSGLLVLAGYLLLAAGVYFKGI